MKCDHCDREATVHEVTVRNGVKFERHLCEMCAEQAGISVQPTKPIDELIKHYVVAHGLTPVVPPAAQPQRATQCPTCKTTYSEFKTSGLLGCPDCYASFEGQLLPLLERAHDGGQRHVGKSPKRMLGAGERAPAGALQEARLARIRALQRELDQAVIEERYELAARLRDELRKLEATEAPR